MMSCSRWEREREGGREGRREREREREGGGDVRGESKREREGDKHTSFQKPSNVLLFLIQ